MRFKKGRSIATAMGLAALDGLPMGQRCGALDPGAVLHLFMELGHDPKKVQQMLYEQSGLLGFSGISGEMNALLASDSAHAQEADDLFVYRCGREFGFMAAALGSVEGVVPTGGMGTYLPEIRARLAAELGWPGITFDARANAPGDTVLSDEAGAVPLLMIQTDEEGIPARDAARLIAFWALLRNHRGSFASLRRLVSGDYIQQFACDGFLPFLAKPGVKILAPFLHVALGVLHGRQTRGMFACQRLGQGTIEQDEEPLADQPRHQRFALHTEERNGARGPFGCRQLVKVILRYWKKLPQNRPRGVLAVAAIMRQTHAGDALIRHPAIYRDDHRLHDGVETVNRPGDRKKPVCRASRRLEPGGGTHAKNAQNRIFAGKPVDGKAADHFVVAPAKPAIRPDDDQRVAPGLARVSAGQQEARGTAFMKHRRHPQINRARIIRQRLLSALVLPDADRGK